MNFSLLFGGGFGVGEGQRTESPAFETWTVLKSHKHTGETGTRKMVIVGGKLTVSLTQRMVVCGKVQLVARF